MIHNFQFVFVSKILTFHDFYSFSFSSLAFKISQNVNNSSYLEKIEKDIQDKVDAIAAVTTDNPKNQTEDTMRIRCPANPHTEIRSILSQ